MANIDTSKFLNFGNLQYYDQKIKKYTKKYTDNQIATFDFIKVVSTLPTEGLENRIYLVPIAVSSGFPTGDPGVYRHGTNFTELLYSWDEIFTGSVQPDDMFGYEYCIYESAGWLNGIVGGDVILPEHYEGDWDWPNIMFLACGNVVIPETYGSGYVYDFKNEYMGRPNSKIECKLEILYLKHTDPSIIYPPYAEDVPHLTKIVVPKGCADAYRSATNWCDYGGIIIEETKEATEDQNLFDEWIWVNKGTEESPEYGWEWITKKQVEIDLTEYATKDFVEQTLLDGTW